MISNISPSWHPKLRGESWMRTCKTLCGEPERNLTRCWSVTRGNWPAVRGTAEGSRTAAAVRLRSAVRAAGARRSGLWLRWRAPRWRGCAPPSLASSTASKTSSCCSKSIPRSCRHHLYGRAGVRIPMHWHHRSAQPRRNRFLLRYTVRHTIAMALAFLSGLFVNNPAMHAALWLLMIGGPPSHRAAARKFTIRAICAAAALSLAALGTILLVPNGTTVFSYMVAIFVGSLIMAYVGQGGGLLSYLSIGGTAFVIAFSGLGPRNDAF